MRKGRLSLLRDLVKVLRYSSLQGEKTLALLTPSP
jgi:hypothetical protein